MTLPPLPRTHLGHKPRKGWTCTIISLAAAIASGIFAANDDWWHAGLVLIFIVADLRYEECSDKLEAKDRP